MSEQTPKYGVSYVASAPEEIKVGDMVEVIDDRDDFYQKKGKVACILMDGGINVDFPGVAHVIYDAKCLRKLPDTILFGEPVDYTVNHFKKITDEMVETYKAKNGTYGNVYADGFNRFGAVQLVSRMYEKYCRIENLLVRNADNKVPDESVLDTLTDLAVQAIVLRTLLESSEVDFENVG